MLEGLYPQGLNGNNNMPKIIMMIYSWTALIISLGGIALMLIMPPPSMRTDRDGVPYFTPMVENPETGDAVSVNQLIRNFRGD